MEIIVIIVSSSDWKGLYVNGTLKIQGHSISTYHIFKELKGRILKDWLFVSVPDEWAEKRGSFPEKYTDVPRFPSA